MFGVMDSLAHEHEISAARSRYRKCQTAGSEERRKDEEMDSEDDEKIF